MTLVKVARIGLAAFIACFLASCANDGDKNECAVFEGIVKNPRNISTLESWVASSYQRGQLAKSKSIEAGYFVFGDYAVQIQDLNIKKIFPEGTQARVIVNPGNRVSAVLFGRMNSVGLVVEMPNIKQEIIPSNVMRKFSERTSLICVPRD